MTNKNRDFDEMVRIVYNDMRSRKDDKSVRRMKVINSTKLPQVLPLQNIVEYGAKSAVTYPELYDKFKGGEWDHKVKAKQVVDSHYHNKLKNDKDKPAAIFASKLPDDDQYLYDHDLWGNISYGYTMKAAGFKDWETERGARIDDVSQSIKRGKMPDDIDDPMVKLGMELYDKYDAQGKTMGEEDLRREILARKDILRRYKKEELMLRRGQREEGDTLKSVADRNDISVENLKSKNLLIDDTKQTINRPLLPNQEEREEGVILDKYRHLYKKEEQMSNSQVGVSVKVDGGTDMDAKSTLENKNKILKAIDENNNPKTDILYKQSSDISENELKESIKYAGYELKDIELKKELDAKSDEWFKYYYSEDTAKQDASGRVMPPEAKYGFSVGGAELKTKDNVPMSEAFSKVAEDVAPLGVRSLQKGLNELGGKKLKEDGDLGPKTTAGLKDMLAKNGLNEVSKNIKYGGFATMLDENRKQAVDQNSLNNMMTTIRPQDGGLFLQQGLNKIGGAKGGFERLNEDNDIGPKTTSAFNQLKEENEDDLNTHARENIAKQIEKTREMEEYERKKTEEKEMHEQEKMREQEEKEQERKRLREQQKLEEQQAYQMSSLA